MKVLQVKEPAMCRMLAATLVGDARKWYEQLPEHFKSSWEQVEVLFETRFRAPETNTMLEDPLMRFKQKDDETLGKYFYRFSEQVSRVAKTMDGVLRGRLIVGLHPYNGFLEELQQYKPKTFHELYSRAESYEKMGEIKESASISKRMESKSWGVGRRNLFFTIGGGSAIKASPRNTLQTQRLGGRCGAD